MTLARSWILKGLASQPSKPAAKQRLRVSSKASAVTATILTFDSGHVSRISLTSSMPPYSPRQCCKYLVIKYNSQLHLTPPPLPGRKFKRYQTSNTIPGFCVGSEKEISDLVMLDSNQLAKFFTLVYGVSMAKEKTAGTDLETAERRGHLANKSHLNFDHRQPTS
jgi:hypothetical protein